MNNDLKSQEISGDNLPSALREAAIFIESISDESRYHVLDLISFQYDDAWYVRIYFYEYSTRGELPK